MKDIEQIFFLPPSPGKELLDSSPGEEMARIVMKELPPGQEEEFFGAALLQGDRQLLRKVLEVRDFRDADFPRGAPDPLILEERLRRNAPFLEYPLPYRESSSSGSLGTAALLGGFFGWIAALLLGGESSGASLAGGALGAAGAFFVVEKLRSSPGLRRALAGLFGVGALSELLRILPSSGGWLGLLRRSSRGFSPLRFLGMLAAIPLVRGCLSRKEVDREALELQLEKLLAQRYAFYRLALRGESLFEYYRQKRLERQPDSPDLFALAAPLYALAGASSETLPEAVEELLFAAREAGFENVPLRKPGEPAVLSENVPRYWSEELRKEYDTLGYLEPGEPVRVERLPAYHRGVLREKGLLRRDKSSRKGDFS